MSLPEIDLKFPSDMIYMKIEGSPWRLWAITLYLAVIYPLTYGQNLLAKGARARDERLRWTR